MTTYKRKRGEVLIKGPSEPYQHTDAERRIRRAMGEMPGGSSIPHDITRAVGFDSDRRVVPITMDSVAAYLEALSELYGEWCTEHTDAERELSRLKSDVAAVRRVLGLPEPE